jgi:membrane AbrB-like protein
MPPALTDLARAALVGALGALGARLLHMPAPDITGPALLAVIAGARGFTVRVPEGFRNATFLIVGVGIGGSVTPAALAEAARWPVSLLMLAAALLAIQLSGAVALTRWRGFDRATAVLAACPGHMSFSIGLGADGRADVGRVTVAHTTRVLLLTLGAPILTVGAFGADSAQGAAGPPPSADPATFLALAAASLALGLWLRARGAPAALLLGGLIATGFANASGLAEGGAPQPLLTVAFVTMGVFVGSRFGGLSASALARDAATGAALTALACLVAGAAALATAALTGLSALAAVRGLCAGRAGGDGGDRADAGPRPRLRRGASHRAPAVSGRGDASAPAPGAPWRRLGVSGPPLSPASACSLRRARSGDSGDGADRLRACGATA